MMLVYLPIALNWPRCARLSETIKTKQIPWSAQKMSLVAQHIQGADRSNDLMPNFNPITLNKRWKISKTLCRRDTLHCSPLLKNRQA